MEKSRQLNYKYFRSCNNTKEMVAFILLMGQLVFRIMKELIIIWKLVYWRMFRIIMVLSIIFRMLNCLWKI